MKSINLQIAGKKQTIYVQQDSFIDTFKTILSSNKYDKVFVLYDNNVKECLNSIERCLESNSLYSLGLDVDFNSKSILTLQEIVEKMVSFSITRSSLFVVIGGGTLGDIGIFLSSIYMRGIDSLFIPTTMMSQCDTIIGKVAINMGKKNVLGSFSSPKFTICDTSLIDEDNLLDGLVEFWKHGLIISEKNIFKEVLNVLNKTNYDLVKIVYKSLCIKYDFVVNDLYDTKNIHKSLSLGHTFANYLEGKFKINHGHAVLIGILFSSKISYDLGYISESKFKEIVGIAELFIEKINLNIDFLAKISLSDVEKQFKSDKISSFGVIRLVLLKSDYFIIEKVSIDRIYSSINWLIEKFYV